jgi:epoxyqueuosine reductase
MAQEFGASLASLAPLSALREPTAQLAATLNLPVSQASVLVLALEHPEAEPELDWWDDGAGGTPGNRRLMAISRQMQHFLTDELGIQSHSLPYHPEKGGILLKDAAALAGLGRIGAHNLLITPHYGTHVRLRALLIGAPVPPAQGPAFDPCASCPRYCWQACPRQAFAAGEYDRARCMEQMAQDEADAAAKAGSGETPARVPYCRACEWACPIGP